MAWQLSNGTLRVTVLAGGGHIAELRRVGGGEESVNPLWQPPWPGIEPDTYDPVAHRGVYGADAWSKTLAGSAGHTLALDYWGRPSDAEQQAGMSAHGEAAFRRWQLDSASKTRLTVEAELPEAGLKVERSLRLLPGQSVVHIEETVTNLTARDRHIDWVEQILLGAPFLNAAHSRFDAAALGGAFVAGEVEGYQPTPWSMEGGEGNARLDFRTFIPGAGSGRSAHFVMDSTRNYVYATALNRKTGLLLGYVFSPDDFGWMSVAEENHSRQELPWKGLGFYRMLAIGNTRPRGATGRANATPDSSDGLWLSAKGEHTIRYLAFLADAGTAAQQVNDVRPEGKDLVIETDAGEPLRLEYDPLYFDLAGVRE